MNKRLLIPLLLAALAAAPIAAASMTERLTGTIDKALAATCVDPSKTAVRVVSLPTGAPLYERNAVEPLMPASVQKLLVTAAALNYLGPDYRFKTTVSHTSALANGIIEGDLYIKGGGDPKLTPESVWLMARRLKQSGVSRVRGALVTDSSFFDALDIAPAWDNQRSQRAYDAKLGALSVSFNVVAVHILPGDRQGDPLKAALFPESDHFELVNNGFTGAQRGGRLNVWRDARDNRSRVVVSGSMPPGARERVFYINVDDPARFASAVFLNYLRGEGITVEHGARAGQTPPEAAPLFTHESEPLAVVLRGLNKHSNNFTAEQVAKAMAAEITGQPGSHQAALELIETFLREQGVRLDGVRLADASGLSRDNRITAAAITDLLSVMRRRFDIGPDFVASLGIMGVDGSVKDRMKGMEARAWARAKTGTLSHVSALAGYVADPQGELYAFTIIMNGVNCHYRHADQIEDAIVSAVRGVNGASQ